MQPEDLSQLEFTTLTRADSFQYVQPEMYSLLSNSNETTEDGMDSRERIYIDLVSYIVHAYDGVLFHDKVKEEASKDYSRFLDKLCREHSQGLNIVDAIDEELSHKWISRDHYRETLFKFKKSCLVDDVHLSERIDVLNYLVKEKGQSPPHVLDVIKWRQCGVLRWLANESYIKLEDPACLSEHLLIRARTALKVTNNIKINRLPKSVSIATFLAFVCVEYDDLFSLQWILSQLSEPKNEDFWISGWNLFHACAFFGRVEIFFHLVQTTLVSTLNQVCERKSFRNCFSSHIAAMKGFTKLVGYLLDAGCPPHTTEGKTVYDLTKDSSYDHVREWGNSRNQIDSLEMDIKRLLSLLEAVPCNIEAIKGHITKTKCMDITLWRTHFDCYHVDEQRSDGELPRMTYRDILERIFSAGNTNLTIWFLEILGPNELDSHAVKNSSRKQFWLVNNWYEDKRIKFSTAVEMVGEKNFLQLLSMDILSNETIEDPSHIHPMIDHVTEYHSDNEHVIKRVGKYQESLLKEMILRKVIIKINWYMSNDILKHKVSIDEIERHRELFDWAIDTLEDHCSYEYEVPDHFVLRKGGKFFVSAQTWELYFSLYKESPLCHQLIIYAQGRRDVQVNHIMAFEGYEDLILWSLSPRQNTWTIEDEIISTRIASCSGQAAVVSLFLEDSNIHVQFKSTLRSRVKAALLGAAESGRKKDVMGYLKNLCLSQDDICIDEEACKKIEEEQCSDTQKKFEAKSKFICSTLVGSSVFGYLTSKRNETKGATESDDDHLQIIGSIMNNTCANAESITVAIHQLLGKVCSGYLSECQRCLKLFEYLVESHKFNVWQNQKCVHDAISQLVSMAKYEKEDIAPLITVLNDFLDFAIIHGVDIQTIFPPFYSNGQNEAEDRAVADLDTAKTNQCKIWSHFDMIEKGDALSSIQTAIGGIEKSWCNREGLGLVHLVAAYDRKDVLIWLVEKKKVSLFQVDGSGRTVLEVAQACSSTDVLQWLVLQHAKLTVSTFTVSQYRRKKAQQKYLSFLDSLRSIQARYRGRNVRRLYHGILSQRFKQVHQFNTIWNKATNVLDETTDSLPWLSWKKIKIEEDDQTSLLEEFTDLDYTTGALGNDFAASLHVDEEHEEVKEFEEEEIERNGLCANCEQYNEEVTTTEYDQHQLKCLQLTKDVIKWLRKCDPKYREFFQRRMKQLADGDRSRILAKGLTGCKTRIFESYLEQKSGFRILWTKMSATDIRVWYVSKHDDVSRHVKLIDEAEKRSRRQLVGALEVDEVGNSDSFTIGNDIMLDPKGNTPMKFYEVTYTNIDRLQDLAWHPPIYLTKEEREIVETNGTVLVVGRSGCGKTICICNRMDYDWRRYSPNNPSFSQLFVSRSMKLRNFAKETVEGCLGEEIESRRFETFPHVLRSLESKLPVDEEQSYSYVPSQKMTFTRFKNEICSSDKSCSIGALTIWKNIHVYIKGSVESLANEEGLSESEYMSLGVRQCKLLPYQRRDAYRAYERYGKYVKEKKLWDDSDRIRSIVRRLNIASRDDPDLLASIRENKIYVDEVQDYLQIEILLFFMLSGPGALFLAGDPAQSVVDGADFQFKDVRMVGFHLFGEEKRDLIPNKPRTVNLNFRSHSGILQVASAVLECLSSAFPNSIAQIGSDKAVFQGPRPSLLYKVSFHSLQQLSKKVEGIVFLTHDENKFNLRRALEQYPLVLGIREVKGLEFQSVVIVDYFGELSKKYQKVWRDLLLGRQIDFQKFPELESHLKLLYTGITRSMQRLLFAETSSSVAGEAFVRWASTTTVTAWNRKQALAVPQSVNDVEAMTRTKDEWRSAGLDNAIMAEQEEIELTEAEEWLEKAMYCFSKSGDTELAMKARTHRKAIYFQQSLISHLEEDQVNGPDFLPLELRAAEMMAQLFQERLILEAHRLTMNIMPMILKSYSEDQITTYLLDKFPSEKEMEDLL